MAEPKFIYADFMKCDYENHLILSGLGTHKDLAKYNITLENGLKFVFIMLLRKKNRSSVCFRLLKPVLQSEKNNENFNFRRERLGRQTFDSDIKGKRK